MILDYLTNNKEINTKLLTLQCLQLQNIQLLELQCPWTREDHKSITDISDISETFQRHIRKNSETCQGQFQELQSKF